MRIRGRAASVVGPVYTLPRRLASAPSINPSLSLSPLCSDDIYQERAIDAADGEFDACTLAPSKAERDANGS